MHRQRDAGMRYVTVRPGKEGPRHFWQRKGYPLTRLPVDEIERHKRAKELNDWADKTPPQIAQIPDDTATVSGIIADYRAHHSFRALAPNTKRYYERWLDDLRQTWGPRRVEIIDKGICEEYLASIPSLGPRRNARAVLRQVMHRAVSLGKLPSNPTNDIQLESLAPRQELFDDEALGAFVTACRAHPTHGRMVYVGFMLLLFTGQRPGDMLRMGWPQYNGRTIRLKQQKTGKWVEIPAHPQLKQMLDWLRPQASAVLINMHGARPVSEKMFNVRFIEVRRAAKLDGKQARDLRRTAVVRMAEGGAEIQDIAAVTGHTIERTRQILEVYLPRTAKMAERGVARMANLSLTFSDQELSNGDITICQQ